MQSGSSALPVNKVLQKGKGSSKPETKNEERKGKGVISPTYSLCQCLQDLGEGVLPGYVDGGEEGGLHLDEALRLLHDHEGEVGTAGPRARDGVAVHAVEKAGDQKLLEAIQGQAKQET